MLFNFKRLKQIYSKETGKATGGDNGSQLYCVVLQT